MDSDQCAQSARLLISSKCTVDLSKVRVIVGADGTNSAEVGITFNEPFWSSPRAVYQWHFDGIDAYGWTYRGLWNK